MPIYVSTTCGFVVLVQQSGLQSNKNSISINIHRLCSWIMSSVLIILLSECFDPVQGTGSDYDC